MDANERVTLIKRRHAPGLGAPCPGPAAAVQALADWQPQATAHDARATLQLAAAMQGLGSVDQLAAALWAGDSEPAEARRILGPAPARR